MDELFGLEYTCYSPLTEDDETKYISEMNGRLMVFDENDDFKELAGKCSFTLVNLQLASQEEFYIPEIFDSNGDLSDICEFVYDHETGRFFEFFKEQLNEAVVGENVIMIHNIEVAEKYRGKNLSALMIRDFLNRYAQNCAMVFLRIFTPQHSEDEFGNEDEKKWKKQMNFQNLEPDEEQAFYKLAAHFQSLGFENVDGNNIFALNLANENPIDLVHLQDF